MLAWLLMSGHMIAEGNSGREPETAKVTPPRERAQLIGLSGIVTGKVYSVFDEEVIGRDAGASIRIDGDDISRHHARIKRMGRGEYILEDLGSSNGTLVNGIPVKEHHLKPGDKLRLGADTLLIFTFRDPLENQFIQSLKMESLGRLVGGVAHDFINLLTTLYGNIDYLKLVTGQLDTQDSDKLDTCLEEMREVVKQASDLARQLLNFASPSKDEEDSVDVSELMDEVIRILRRSFTNDIIVATSIQPNLLVKGDRSQLHRVLMNLCLNAKDAMPTGGQLSILAEELEQMQADECSLPVLTPGQYVLITVRDTGTGMDEETARHIFEPFFTTKRPGEGTGLGLALVYSLVQAHGGKITVTSELNVGSTFRVYLPLSEPADA
jgi:signal transduction histidine kinase